MRTKNQTVFAIIVIVVIAVASALGIGVGIYSFTPGVAAGFQGPITEVYGVKDNCGTSFSLGQLPLSICSSTYSSGSFLGIFTCVIDCSTQWTWPSTSVTSPEVKISITGYSSILRSGTISESVPYSISSPQQLCSTSGGANPCTPVRYVTQNASGYYDNNGEVVTYRYSTEIKASTISDPNIIINGLSFINSIAFQHWLSAYDPVNNTWQGYVSQYALFLVISKCQEANQKYSLSQCGVASGATNDVINPESQGSQVALYNNPHISGGWNSLGCSISNDCSSLNATLSSNGSPSQQITPAPVYYPEELSSFGAYGCSPSGTGSCYPDVTLTFTLYTLLIGSYFAGSTNPDKTQYVPTPPGKGCNALCQTLTLLEKIAHTFTSGSMWLFALAVIVVVSISATIVLSVRGHRR